MTSNTPSVLRAVTLTLLLVASAAAAGVGAGAHDGDTPSPAGEGTPSHADEVYVDEDGSAVLVYGPENTDDSAEMEYGVNASEELAYALVTDPTVGNGSLRADVTASATPTNMQADGELSADRPESLAGLDLDISALTNDSVSRADASLNATLSGNDGFARLVTSAGTSGNVTASASQFRATGQFDADLAVPLGSESSYGMGLTEQDDGYTLEIEEQRRVGQFGAADWENRSAARRTIERQYGSLARSLGGEASVSIDSYSFEGSETDQSRLDIAYTVSVRDVDAGIEEAVRASLADDPDVNGTQADRIASEITDVTIDELAVQYRTDSGGVSGSFDVDVSEYHELALAYLEVAESTNGTGGYAGNVEQARAQFEAQQAAGLEQRLNWTGRLVHPDDESTRIGFEYHERTENRSTYVEELESRDLPTYDSVLQLSGSIDGDSVVFSGSANASGEDLFDGVADSMGNTTADGGNATGLFAAVGRSGPQKAKVELTTDDGGLTVESAAAFANMGALRDELASEEGVPQFAEAVGRTDDGGTTSYVRVSGAVEADASESDVRSLDWVDRETTVHMPGEWDREFPTMDTERAESFLGSIPGRDGAGASGPGFGIVAALAALVGSGALVARRRG